jgi:hypothetical protein
MSSLKAKNRYKVRSHEEACHNWIQKKRIWCKITQYIVLCRAVIANVLPGNFKQLYTINKKSWKMLLRLWSRLIMYRSRSNHNNNNNHLHNHQTKVRCTACSLVSVPNMLQINTSWVAEVHRHSELLLTKRSSKRIEKKQETIITPNYKIVTLVLYWTVTTLITRLLRIMKNQNLNLCHNLVFTKRLTLY